jgi:hypothetical protein
VHGVSGSAWGLQMEEEDIFAGLKTGRSYHSYHLRRSLLSGLQGLLEAGPRQLLHCSPAGFSRGTGAMSTQAHLGLEIRVLLDLSESGVFFLGQSVVS